MQRAAEKINQFKQGLTRQDFLADEKTQSAIVFQLLIIGEATKRLSLSLRQQYPQPWSLMAGMRDNLIHEMVLIIFSLKDQSPVGAGYTQI
ncbi:DUF86 domain-containing protein [Roseofilum sp. BLCC_M154]|uniref:DUF86 domain-containing protein n=1 Tax=Roseofilum acuticapitatum BLCC-M154 TaxID=3022444 RepID=A0ABT7AMV6_9CYAN|nr:DUF86 domain-containing protein [Roseofilum acuticapitatum BLCC-M154]